MKKVIFIILFSLISFSVYAKDQICSNKAINPAVQLQDNGWLKIVDQYIEESTPEEFYSGDEQAIKSHKESVKLLKYKTEKIRKLHVKIQFLKPCVATTEFDEYLKNYNGKDDNNIIPLTGEKGECIALLADSLDAQKQGNKEKSDEFMKKAVEQCPNIMDYIDPRFRCNYRFKVFNTTFTPSKLKKYESSEFSFFPAAPTIDIKDNRIYRKDEMLPGETMWITFPPISGNETSWCVWVPK
jgi:hypothetical protein